MGRWCGWRVCAPGGVRCRIGGCVCGVGRVLVRKLSLGWGSDWGSHAKRVPGLLSRRGGDRVCCSMRPAPLRGLTASAPAGVRSRIGVCVCVCVRVLVRKLSLV